ncbi:MAG: hypothetical protein HDT39_05525 [Lachnospiraceae bacterium]|nr:hypothetical protein [Lachnospiraceae bacterium]
MYLYNFDIVNQKIIQYNDADSDAMIVDLFHPLLSFINSDFSEYDLLRRKIILFIQEFENKFDEMDSNEIELEIEKAFPNLHLWDIDNGEIWWISGLIAALVWQHSHYEPFFFSCGFSKDSIQDKNDYDYLYWQKKIRDKVYKIFDIDNKNFIKDFSPICRLNYCDDHPINFKEVIVIHPSGYEKIHDNYESFGIPFNPENPNADPYTNCDYAKKEPQRQEFIKNHLHVLNGYEFKSIEEAFNCEIFKMAQIGITLRRCQHCGKYFKFNPNQPAKYCTNKLYGVNMTCQQVASQKKYKENQSPIQRTYLNALKNRNKWYPSKKSGLRTPEQTLEYENWKKRTSAIRNEFQQKYDTAQTDIQRKKILEEFKGNLNL